MTAKLAPSDPHGYAARPKNPLSMWHDGRWIFVELPSKTVPCIIKFPLHEGGLWRALNVLHGHSFEFAGPPMAIERPIDPKISAAHKILKDRGILR